MEKPHKHSMKVGKKEKGGVAASTGPIAPVLMNPHHTTPAAIAEYAKAFHSGTPFPHLLIQDAFPEEVLRAVRREVAAFDFNQKGNDLYHFQQTDDLRTVQGNTTAAVRDFIYTEQFRTWMAGITGIETNATIDIFAAKYDDASYLLCHDDDLAQRRIAYIIYLVPDDWTEEDGGALDLFSVSKDADTVPDSVVRSMPPTFNAMAFFEVRYKCTQYMVHSHIHHSRLYCRCLPSRIIK
jgi:Rps23 Pro-64 3,4-dihydroxylase Tpa1-like proline 4-hydroxylase